MANNSSFFAELKRRNVYKVAVAYAIAAWLLIQASSIFLPAFDAPGWSMRAMIILLAICFPVALVLAWAFEITPEGIKRESEIERNKSVPRQTGRKLTAIIILVAILATGLFMLRKFKLTADAAPKTAALTSSLSQNEKSVAVL